MKYLVLFLLFPFLSFSQSAEKVDVVFDSGPEVFTPVCFLNDTLVHQSTVFQSKDGRGITLHLYADKPPVNLTPFNQDMINFTSCFTTCILSRDAIGTPDFIGYVYKCNQYCQE